MRLLVVLAILAWFVGASPSARAQTAACSGTGTVTGPWSGSPSSGQVWVTDSSLRFEQQTEAGQAFGAARGCSSVDFSGRQSSQVTLFLGSCADPANDGSYTWTDSLHTCDMSLPLAGGEPPPEPAITGTQATLAVGFVALFALGWVAGRQR